MRLLQGEEQASQHGPERLRLDVGTGRGRDRRRGGVSLLGGKPALLDREGRAVAGGVDPVVVDYAAVCVGWDEPARRLGEAMHAGPAHRGKRDHAIGLDQLCRRRDQAVKIALDRPALREQLDAALGEQILDLLRRRFAEDLQWGVLGGDENELRVRADILQPVRGHQRQLVERQQPADAARSREDQPAGESPLDVVEEAREVLAESGRRDGERAGNGDAKARARRDQQRVVLDVPTAGRDSQPGVGPHRLEPVRNEGRPIVRDDPPQVESPDTLVAEQRSKLERPVDELGVRRDELDLDTLLGELPQDEQCLERRHTATGDNDPVRVRGGVRAWPGGQRRLDHDGSSIGELGVALIRAGPSNSPVVTRNQALDWPPMDDQRLARLVDVGRSLVSELDLELVLDRLLDVAREITGARYAALGILDERKEELEQFLTVGIDAAQREEIGALPRGRGVLGLLIRDPRPLRLEDVGAHPDSYGFPPEHPPMETFLGVPVIVRGEAWGNLYLTEKQGGPFTQEDEDALLILADWAAIAIENARLYQGVERRRGELEYAVRGLEATLEIARALAGETELDRVLELIVKRGRALVEATGVVIMLLEGDELTVAATAGTIADSAEGARLPVGGSLSGEVALSGRPERIEDVQARLKRGPTIMAGVTSALLVPLVFRGGSHGVLAALDRRTGGPAFTAEDERLMAGFAASAAAAVATARSVAEDRLRLSIETAEQERKRWARELHDDTLQGLAGLGVVLGSALRAGSEDAMRSGIESAREQIREEVEKLRGLISELRPAALDEIGLRAAVESLVERTAATQGLDISTAISLSSDAGAPRLPPEVESTAYRIVQEGITNAAKHSRAAHVEVQLEEVDGRLDVAVRDDGRGFEPSAPRTGFGLTGMRERVEMLGGSLALESSPAGLGTLVRASLPLRRHS